jgi:hypothetical protein
MFVKINTTYSVSLLVKDINGNRITNDLPILTIKNVKNNTYFNGMIWQPSITNIIMEHIADGVYKYDFTPTEIGVYELTAESEIYNISKTESIEVYDTDVAKYDWQVGTVFTIKYTKTSDENVPTVRLIKDKSELYWNGVQWVTTISAVSMNEIDGGVCVLDFVPDEEGEYSVFIIGATEVFYIINATQTSDNTAPVLLNNYSFKYQDGTDSTIFDEKSVPLPGVQITCFDVNTKQVVAKTYSNNKGEWNMSIKPGRYFFMFEKDNYISVSFERSVM